MPSQRKLGAALGYVNILVKNVVNLLYTPLLLHFLGQSTYGVFQMTNSVVFALTILSAGFYGAYVRFYTLKKTQGSDQDIRKLNGMFLSVYGVVALLCILVGLMLMLRVDDLFSRGLAQDEIALTRSLMVVMVINIVVTLLSTPFDSYIVVHERFAFQQSRQMVTTLLTPVFAFGLLYFGFGAVGVSVAQLAVSVILLAMNVRFAVTKLGMRFSFKGFDYVLLRAIAVFSFWIFLNQIFDLINNQVPNFLLGAMKSAAAVATFSVALQIRNIFFSMSTTMSNVFVPSINRIVATTNDNHLLSQLMTRVGRYQMILFCYLFGGFVILGEFFVEAWAGKQNIDAYYLAVIMTLPVCIPLSQNIGIEIQRAKNKHKIRSLIYIGTAILDLLVSVIFIPSIGYWATAIGYVASILLGTGLFMNWYYQYRLDLSMTFFWKKVGVILLCSGLLTILCVVCSYLIFPVTTSTSFVTWGCIYSLLFFSIMWKYFLTQNERSSIVSRIRRRR